MNLTPELVEHLSALARLELPAEEQQPMAAELERLLTYMDVLNTLDTAGIEPMSHIFPLKNVLRPDVVSPSMPQDALLQNSPAPDGEAFLVPKAVDGI